MGWSIGFDPAWNRDIGYGVPAWCDHPDCTTSIDRGLSFVCGGQPLGGDHGCGLFFCSRHLNYAYTEDGSADLTDADGNDLPQMCERCIVTHQRPQSPPPRFEPKAEHPDWAAWKLSEPSRARWRAEHPDEVASLMAS